MIFLSTMVLIVAMTTQSAVWLRSELNLLERRQVERLQRLSAENTSGPSQPQTPSGKP